MLSSSVTVSVAFETVTPAVSSSVIVTVVAVTDRPETLPSTVRVSLSSSRSSLVGVSVNVVAAELAPAPIVSDRLPTVA